MLLGLNSCALRSISLYPILGLIFHVGEVSRKYRMEPCRRDLNSYKLWNLSQIHFPSMRDISTKLCEIWIPYWREHLKQEGIRRVYRGRTCRLLFRKGNTWRNTPPSPCPHPLCATRRDIQQVTADVAKLFNHHACTPLIGFVPNARL